MATDGKETDEPGGTRPRYVREQQHGPEMDDTQVEATGEFADTLEPVEGGDDDHDQS